MKSYLQSNNGWKNYRKTGQNVRTDDKVGENASVIL